MLSLNTLNSVLLRSKIQSYFPLKQISPTEGTGVDEPCDQHTATGPL